MRSARVGVQALRRAAAAARQRNDAALSPWRFVDAGPTVLPAAFYDRPTLDVARDLLGKLVIYASPAAITAGLIVEVEAYIGESDPACHAAPGPTRRNEPLYGPPGRSYLYLNYGMHVLLNVVTEREGFPAAVLVRALDPILGVEHMRARRRGTALDVASRGDESGASHQSRAASQPSTLKSSSDVQLCRGPGRLSRALGLSLELNRADLSKGPLVFAHVGIEPQRIAWTTRVGLNVGTDRPWRAVVEGSPCVSPWRGGGRPSRRKR